MAWLAPATAPADATDTPASRYETVIVPRPRPADAPAEDRIAAATVIRPEDRPQAVDSLPDALGEAPGVVVTRLGGMGAFATASLRGLPATQVQIYLDGVPLNLAEGGAVDLSSIPVGDIERIEVYRGVTPLAFGEAGLGGVISITSRRAGTRAPSVELGGGSFGTLFGGTSAGAQLGRLRLYAGLHGMLSRGTFPYVDDRGTVLVPADDVVRQRRNNELRQADGIVRAAVDLAGRRELSLLVLGVGRAQGISGVGQFPALRSHLDTDRAIAALCYRSREDLGPNGHLQAQLFASSLRQAFSDPLAEVGQTSLATRDRTMSVGVSVLGSRAAGFARPALQLEARSEWFLPRSDVTGAASGFPATRALAIAGTEVRLRSERWTAEVVPSARVQLSRDEVTGRDFFLRFRASDRPVLRALPMLRLSAEKDLGESCRLRSNLGRYSRIPSMTELYGQTGMLVGNPELQPETGTTADIGVIAATATERATARLELTGFASVVSDLIEWETITRYQIRARNVGRARILGGEASARITLGELLLLVGQATYTDARDTGSDPAGAGKQLPLVPRMRAYARIEVRAPWRPTRALEVRAYGEADLTAGKFLDRANLMAVSPRLLLGAGLSVGYPRAGLRITASAQNLSDTRTVDVGNFPLPGRAYFVGVAWGEAVLSTKENPQ